jgi:hypothetical protein
MNAGELIVSIREDYLDDIFDGWELASEEERNDQFLWSDKALFRYITEAQRQACNRTDFLYDESSNLSKITLKDGVRNYKIDPKITVIEEILYDGEPVIHITKEMRDRMLPNWQTATADTSIGNKRYYWARGRNLYFYPIPGATDAGQKMQMSIWHTPVDNITSNEDELVIVDEYQRDLIWWVLYEAYSKQDADGYDKDRGLGYLAQFNDIFGPSVDSLVRNHQFESPKMAQITPAPYYIANQDDFYDNENW